MSMHGWTRLVVATVIALAGCTGSALDKSGGTTAGRVLVLANNDGDGLTGVPSLQRFVDRVKELSRGNLLIQVHSSWSDDYDEPGLLQDVAAGRADLGWSGTRALDLAGAREFRPLHAPFLIGTFAAERAVLRDKSLTRDLLATLRRLGVLGLALTADEIRFPVGVQGPLRRPADFRHQRFATFPSGVQSEAIKALGATPVPGIDENAITTRTIVGFESMWWTYNEHDYAAVAPFPTINAGLWPRTVALFANPRVFYSLDAEQQHWIRLAAADATAWSLLHAEDDQPAQIASSCAHGARVVTATSKELRALRAAVEPVYQAMQASPRQRRYLHRITALAAAAGSDPKPHVPAACAYHPGDEKLVPPPAQELTGPGRPGDLPQGYYRYTLTEKELRAHGLSTNDAHLNAGIITWSLHDGHWESQQQPVGRSVQDPSCKGWYDVQGATATFTTTTRYAGGTCAPSTWSARWTFVHRQLIWSAVSIADFTYVWGGKPWQQIR